MDALEELAGKLRRTLKWTLVLGSYNELIDHEYNNYNLTVR